MVLELPVPVVVVLPGLRVIVQLPVEGSPLSKTLPVESAQVGWVMVPTTGASGATGAGLITTWDEFVDVHPALLVTLKV